MPSSSRRAAPGSGPYPNSPNNMKLLLLTTFLAPFGLVGLGGSHGICGSASPQPGACHAPIGDECEAILSHSTVELRHNDCYMLLKLEAFPGTCESGCELAVAGCETNGNCCEDPTGDPVFAIIEGSSVVHYTCSSAPFGLGPTACGETGYQVFFRTTDSSCSQVFYDQESVFFACYGCL